MSHSHLAAEVRALAAAMQRATSGARVLAIEAVAIGHQLGTALTLARDGLEQGVFAVLLRAAEINAVQALKLEKLAQTYTLDEVRLRSGAQRQAMFALGYVPEKERREHDGDDNVAVSVGLGTCVGHWAKYVRAVEMGRAVLDKEQAKRQTCEMHLWLCALHGTPLC